MLLIGYIDDADDFAVDNHGNTYNRANIGILGVYEIIVIMNIVYHNRFGGHINPAGDALSWLETAAFDFIIVDFFLKSSVLHSGQNPDI